MKFLVTGFDPFGGESINPAFEAAKLLPESIEGHSVIKAEVPTVFGKSIDTLAQLLAQHKPDWVICVGQAGGRDKISLEKVAINYDQARIKDNEGNQPMDQDIKSDGDTAYFTKLPIKAGLKSWLDHGIPGEISYSAGTFVCNHIFYGLMYLIDKKYPGVKGGFIHVPFLPEQTLDKKNTPYMTKEMMAEALELVIKACIEHPKDDVSYTASGTIA